MPETTVVFYKELDGSVPVLDWLMGEILRKDRQLFARCLDAFDAIREQGRDLRRPVADYLRDGIFELRIRYYRENYRILYFFHRGDVAVVSHGIVKESEVPDREIDVATERKMQFEKHPEAHTYEEH